jgi:hypothetical protein
VFHSIRDLRRALVWAVSTVMLAAVGVFALAVPPAAAASTATGGVGATLPYVEVQAENSATNGTVIGPSYATTRWPTRRPTARR